MSSQSIDLASPVAFLEGAPSVRATHCFIIPVTSSNQPNSHLLSYSNGLARSRLSSVRVLSMILKRLDGIAV